MEKTYQSDSEKVMSIVNLWMKEAWQNGNYSIIDELHSKDFIDHSPADRGPTIRDFKNSIAQLYQAFPDFYAKIEDIIIDLEHGKVALRWSAQGTQMGEFMRVPATGKKMNFRGIEILIIKENKIVERWGEWDGINVLEQLGVI